MQEINKKGYVSIHRQIEDTPLWKIKPFSKGQAWVDIIICTNHKKGIIIAKNGLVIDINRGECGYSLSAFADRWGWSRNKVKRFIVYLENEKMIQQKNIHNHTIIIVLNYDKFQNGATNDTTNGHQTKQQTDTNNNDNNVNKYISDNKKFKIPTIEEIRKYCLEEQIDIDVEYFWNHYEGNGWYVGRNKMKNWKTTVKNWAKRNFNNYSKSVQSKEVEYNANL